MTDGLHLDPADAAAPAPTDDRDAAAATVGRARHRIAVGCVWAGVVVLAATAALLVATAEAPTVARVDAPTWSFALVAVAFYLAERTSFHIQYRREAISFSLAEVPAAFAVVFLAPVVAVPMRAVAGLVAKTQQSGRPVYKLAFNTALFAFEMAFTYRLVELAVGSDRSPGPLVTALAASLAVAYLLGSVAVTVAISCFEGAFVGRLAGELRTSLLTGPASASIAAVAVAPALFGWQYAAISAIPVAIGWLLASRYGRLQEGHRELLEVHRFTAALGRSLDIGEIAPTAVAEFARLLRARRAVLVVFGDDGTVHETVSVGAAIRGLPATDDDEFVGSLGDSVVACDLRGARPAVRAAGRVDAIGVPLHDDRGLVGVVILADRHGAVGVFDDNAIERAATLGRQLAAILRSCLLYASTSYAARHDALTGQLNRAGFETEVADAVGTPGSAVLMIDLDRFKEVNDTLGHHMGDRMLVEFAHRLDALVGPDDRVARLGGDEFVVLLRHRADRAAVRETAEWILSEARRPMALDGMDVVVTASIGIASLVAADTPVDAIRRADVAMYAAKRRHSGYEEYRHEIDRRTPQRLALLADLRDALDGGQLDVHFQPKIDLATGTVVGAESLVRWHHRSRGWIAPDEFVAIAEETGLIVSLSDQVLARSLDAASRWAAEGFDLAVSVNLSAHDLLDELLVERLRRRLEQTGVAAHRLTLEITESALLVDTPRTMSTVERLHGLGIRLSLDDFGTGYSSLSYLRRLPVDELKIDRSFVTNVLLDAQDEVIVRSTIDLGHNLGLSVVAEGIESAPVLDRLRDLGCDLAQGFGICRPLDAELFDTWLRTTDHHVPGRGERPDHDQPSTAC